MTLSTTIDLVDFLEHEVYPKLDRGQVFAILEPRDKGAYYECRCPGCGKREAWSYKDSFVLQCNRLNHCGFRTTILQYVAGTEGPPRGRDFVEAVRSLASLAVVAFPEREWSPEAAEHYQRRETRRTLLGTIMDFTARALWTDAGTTARRYLTEDRGLSEQAIRELQLGLYPSVQALRDHLLVRKHDATLAEQAGLLWEKLEGYVVVPWLDPWGQPLTLAGRWPHKHLTEGKPKVLHLPGQDTKTSPLYFDRARKAGHRDLVAVEGLFDAALLQSQGETRVVALGGAAVPAKQLEVLARHRIRSVTLVLDPDEAGERGTLSSLRSFRGAGIEVFVAPALPGGLDPDDFVRLHGLVAWRELLHRAKPGAWVETEALLRGLTTDSSDVERRQAVQRVLEYQETLSGAGSSLDTEDVLKLLAQRTGYEPVTLRSERDFLAQRRRQEVMGHTLDRLLSRAQEERKDRRPEEVARELGKALGDLQAEQLEAPAAFSVARLEQESREYQQGLSSGWKVLDRGEVLFNPGELIVCGARTGHCKTTFLVGLLANWLREAKEDEVFLFYSMEEPELRIFHRLVALQSDLFSKRGQEGWSVNEVRDFLRDPYSRDSWPFLETLQEAKLSLRAWERRLQIVYRPSWSVEDIVAHARRMAERTRVGAVVVDYLQRIPPPSGGFERRDIEVSQIARWLKSLAVEIRAPVVVGAQINREPARESRVPSGAYNDAMVQRAIQARRPQLHHLREGGAEQEADLVLGLLNYRADYEESEQGNSISSVTRLEVGLLKNRYGSTGRWLSLAFEGRLHLLRDPYAGELEWAALR